MSSGIDIKALKEAWWLEYCLEGFVSGSRVICNPPVEGTDLDVMVLVDEAVVGKLEQALRENGFSLGGSADRGGPHKPLKAWPSDQEISSRDSSLFHSWKKGDLNLLVTASDEYFDNFYKATSLGIGLNLLKKRDRIQLFEAVTANRWPLYSLRIK